MRMQERIARLGFTMCLALAGCGGGGSGSQPASTTTINTTTTTGTSTVNLVVTDTPSTKVTILSFQVQITGAVLQPGSVSILPRPMTVDLAQLVTDTSLLASTVIGSATYTSLEMTFANPQVTLLNNTGATLTLAGQSCAAGATCTFVPALNNATVTISSGVFPLTVTASSSTGLNLDLSIPDLLQSDLSITLANGSSVNLSLLSGTSSASQQAKIEDVIGSITAINGDQVNITTALGDSLVLTDSSSTAYYYPSTVCSTASASCLATGQIVTFNLSLLGSGALGINSVSYLANSGSQLAKGLVLSTDITGATPTAQVLVQREMNVASLSMGQIATVSLPAGTTYSVGTPVYPAISTASFAGASDLLPGQELILSVGSDLVAGASPAFSTDTVYLEPSQVIGAVNSVNAASSSLVIDGLSGLFTGSRPLVQLMDIQTGSATNFVGVASISALTAGQFVAAKGPLFNTTGSSYPNLAAVQLSARTAGN